MVSTDLVIRHDLRPGDVGQVVYLHGTIYAVEYGFDPTFEAYVAGPLAEFVRNRPERGRLWLAESGGQVVGSVAIVEASADEAQLRWFLVSPSARGRGVGKRLLTEAINYSRDQKFRSVFLWTVSALQDAARLYRAVGFELVERKPGVCWGVEVVEERYELRFSS